MQNNSNNKKKQDVSKNMTACHFLLIVIAIESSLKYKREQNVSKNWLH